MKKSFLFLAATLFSTLAFSSQHTGYCRFGEECGDIVSTNLREAQRICSRRVFDREVLAVNQQQQDGSVVFIGYTCVNTDN